MNTCAVCLKPFEPTYNTMQAVCGTRCALRAAKAKRKKEREYGIASIKARKAAIKPRSAWLKEAKTAMQRFRRLEELAKGAGCMSCGRSQAEVTEAGSNKPGGLWDGGHYMSKGARPELALEPRNIWLQCKSCNGGSGKYARKGYTVHASFRANLIAQEGLLLVEWLEGPHESKKHTVADLCAILEDIKHAKPQTCFPAPPSLSYRRGAEGRL